MRSLNADSLAALDSGRFALRTLLRVDLDGGPVGFWDDAYDITVSSQLYWAAAGAFRVNVLPSASDQGVRAVEVAFSGLNSAIATSVEDADWHQRAVAIFLAVIAVETPQLVNVAQWFTGFADTAVRRETPGGPSELVFRCESIGRELSRKGARTRSDADQRQIDSLDGFFKHVVAASNVPVQWGPNQSARPPERKKFLGLF